MRRNNLWAFLTDGSSPSLLLVSRLTATVLSLGTAPIVARAIGPSGRGETAAALALFVIVPVLLAVGLPLEVRRRAATSDGQAVMRAARRIVLASTVPAALLAWAAYATVFAEFSPQARVVAAVGLLLTPLSAHWALDISLLVAHRRYGSVFLLQVAQPFVYLACVVTVWALGLATVGTVLGSHLVGSFATFALGMSLVRVSFTGPKDSLRGLTRAGMKFFGGALAEAATNKLDQVVALPLIGAYQTGLYSVAATIAAAPLALGHALGAAYFTPIAQAEGKERAKLQAESLRSGLAAAIATIPLVAVASWIGIPIIFGEAFRDSIPVTLVSLVGSAAMLSAYVASMALAADAKGIRMTVAQVVALTIGMVGLLVLGPAWGAIGAATASSIAYVCLLVLLVRSLGVSPWHIAPRPADFGHFVRRLRKG
ncbi:lipopolysaccharide biosynthesis protein [Sanguibacter suaedae]|uniref:Oligosaccharide flippase family protein n=1 Tax=Sanguibacter suaedae TaxID=2795737 RepID=A0A934IDV9_9MICO|nr:oligosaccharide flippase family protein [Sanguibacter suaedae]MBI9116198.1 oligosaccharide flippase family protein [Sanguibacter suaedae]